MRKFSMRPDARALRAFADPARGDRACRRRVCAVSIFRRLRRRVSPASQHQVRRAFHVRAEKMHIECRTRLCRTALCRAPGGPGRNRSTRQAVDSPERFRSGNQPRHFSARRVPHKNPASRVPRPEQIDRRLSLAYQVHFASRIPLAHEGATQRSLSDRHDIVSSTRRDG